MWSARRAEAALGVSPRQRQLLSCVLIDVLVVVCGVEVVAEVLDEVLHEVADAPLGLR